MICVRPFTALVPPEDMAAKIASPPYDVVDTAEARTLAGNNAASFLHVVRSEIDLPDGTPVYDQAVYFKARENLAGFVRSGVLRATPSAGFLIYRLIEGDHQQTGLVACCAVDDYEAGVIRKHENTKPDKEKDRTEHMLALRAHAEPVLLAYQSRPRVNELITTACEQIPLFDFRADDGVQHVLWEVEDPVPFVEVFAAVPRLYIADGHHRCASARRARQMMREQNPSHSGEEEYNYFPAVLFSSDELRILPYNRVLRKLDDWSPEDFLRRLRQDFERSVNTTGIPHEKGEVDFYLRGEWHGIRLRSENAEDPVAALDVNRLQTQLLEPYFGMKDQRTDARIDFVGGMKSVEMIQKMVDRGEAQIGISLYPTAMAELIAVSDARKLMPPKSTWFDPKLQSGLFVHPF